ncbi:MAG: hypothetical protein KDC54_24895 [Lewinella sp.]|nr:hypothetical protein [Lewinella sp.]
MSIKARIDNWHSLLFSHRLKDLSERAILYMGVLGFLAHLLLIYLNRLGWLPENVFTAQHSLSDPLAAIYTPFSFILIYEVYLLVYYLPSSFTTSIAKQFEIISLIEVRNIFKDISHLEMTTDWFAHEANLAFTVDTLGFLVLFSLIYWFHRLRVKKPKSPLVERQLGFITMKRLVSIILLFVLGGLAIYSLGIWLLEMNDFRLGHVHELSDVNKIFYNDFFTLLVLVDVFILMMSFHYTEKYSQLIRNSGYIISTVLIRLSFSSGAILNMALIIAGLFFGVIILLIYNRVSQVELD